MKELRELIYNQHDIICNQKYGDSLPYSFHLKVVETQGKKFFHLLENNLLFNTGDEKSQRTINIKKLVEVSLIAHDLLEDARLTYNDIIDLIEGKKTDKKYGSCFGKNVADIVYCLTDEKGKNRAERKNEKYYKELKENPLAVFVKLADISANTLYSKLTGSSMYEKYKKEFPSFKEKVYLEEFKEFFEYVESL